MNYGENFHNNGHQVESNLTMAIEKDKLIVVTEVAAALNEKINTSDVLTLTDLSLSAFR